MSSRHRSRSRSHSRDRHKKDRDRDRHRHSSGSSSSSSSKRFLSSLLSGIEAGQEIFKESSKRERSRSRERRSKDRRRSRSRGRKSKDRDGTIALLDQMVGTTTTTTSRQINGVSANTANHAALLAAAAVAQVSYQRRIQAPIQPAAAAAAALSAATAIPLPSSVQQRLEQLQAKHGHRGRDRHRSRSRDRSKERSHSGDRVVTSEDRDEGPPGETAAERRERRRRTRWGGSEHDKTFIPGLPTVLPSSLTKEQEEQYLLQLQIEEVSRKLRSGDLGIPVNIEERSPSPEPIYSTDGKRLNTREYRTRRKLEEERHKLVQRMQQINPEFKPPADYKPPIIRVHDKVMIPQEEHPDINFVGLLIGPRGNTLKSMEKETGAKIIIRGKGSVKEGKVGRKDGHPLPGEDEPLHAYITATNAECVKKAVEKIKEVIRQGVEVPEGQNDLRRMQLRELAQLNGTLRENDTHRCANCAATDHKTWLCPDKPNVTNNIVCLSCGGAGHIARDCRQKRPGQGGPPGQAGGGVNKAKIDEEYMSLMAELGEAPPPQPQDKAPPPRRTYYGSPFGNRDNQPRAIMGAPSNIPPSLPPPPSNYAPPPPPHQQVPPPWLNNSQPPPPGAGVNTAVPPLMSQYPQNDKMGGPPGNMGNMGGPPGTMGNMGGPPSNMGNMGGPQGNMGNMGGPQGNMNNMGGQPGNMGNMGGQPGNMGGPPGMPPPGMMGPPMGMPPPPGMGHMGGGGWRGGYPGMNPPPWSAPPPPPPPPQQHGGFLAPPPPPPPS